VAEACQWGSDRCELRWGGRAESLIADLAQRPTRRLLFAGHTDTETQSGGRSLGFTTPGGGLAPFDTDELVDLLSYFFAADDDDADDDAAHGLSERRSEGGAQAATRLDGGMGRHRPGCAARRRPTASKVLRLVFLNGCHSEGLGARLRARGAECVVCWRTATRDDGARLFSAGFFQSLAESASKAAKANAVGAGSPSGPEQICEAHHSSDDYVRAFDAAVQAVRNASRSSRKSPLRRAAKFELADPQQGDHAATVAGGAAVAAAAAAATAAGGADGRGADALGAADGGGDADGRGASARRAKAVAIGIHVLMCDSAGEDRAGILRVPMPDKRPRRGGAARALPGIVPSVTRSITMQWLGPARRPAGTARLPSNAATQAWPSWQRWVGRPMGQFNRFDV
jgi:hypothetical protein